jgi:hypothetical protein
VGIWHWIDLVKGISAMLVFLRLHVLKESWRER